MVFYKSLNSRYIRIYDIYMSTVGTLHAGKVAISRCVCVWMGEEEGLIFGGKK